jgi:hypothetical protein
MVGPFPGVPYSFGALRETFGPLFVRCDVCRRYARLYPAEIHDTDYRTKTFSYCRYGTDGALAITEPNTETGMTDCQLDQVEGPQQRRNKEAGAFTELGGQGGEAYHYWRLSLSTHSKKLRPPTFHSSERVKQSAAAASSDRADQARAPRQSTSDPLGRIQSPSCR